MWALLAIALLGHPTGASAADCPRVAAHDVAATDAVPAGLNVSGRKAVQIARATNAARGQRPDMIIVKRLCGDLQVYGVAGERPVLDVLVDGSTGAVKNAFGGYHAQYLASRGSPTLFLTAAGPLIIVALTVVFAGAFFDPRRPFRATHVDLLVLTATAVSLIPYRYGDLEVATPLVFIALGLLATRMLMLAFRPSPRAEQLVPYLSPHVLLAAAVVLLAGRSAYNAAAVNASDVGYFSVYGAQSLLDGYSIYSQGSLDASAYGPAMHLAYLPFAALFPLPGGYFRGADTAAHVAAITFDCLTAALLYILGWRLRRGQRGHALGAVLAFSWAANPLVFYAVVGSANDAFVALLLVIALLGIESPAGRGVAAGLAAAAKWVPVVLLPLLAAGPRALTRRTALIFTLAVVASVAVSALPFMPAGGPIDIYRVSVGDLANIQSPFNVWGLWHLPTALRELFFSLVLIGAVAAAWIPRQRSFTTVAALATAIVAAIQMALPYWSYAYAVWFMAIGAVAICTTHETISAEARPAPAPASPSQRARAVTASGSGR